MGSRLFNRNTSLHAYTNIRILANNVRPILQEIFDVGIQNPDGWNPESTLTWNQESTKFGIRNPLAN